MDWNTRSADWVALLIAAAGLVVAGFIAERVYERVPHIEDEWCWKTTQSLVLITLATSQGEHSLTQFTSRRRFTLTFTAVVAASAQRTRLMCM